MEDLEDAGWTTSKTGQGYQQRSVSREHVKDSSGVNWCGRRPWSPTFSNEVGLKMKKKRSTCIAVHYIQLSSSTVVVSAGIPGTVPKFLK